MFIFIESKNYRTLPAIAQSQGAKMSQKNPVTASVSLVKFRTNQDSRAQWGILRQDADSGASRIVALGSDVESLDQILVSKNAGEVWEKGDANSAISYTISDVELLAPIDSQEVWGAGVTYFRSKIARQEESKSGGSFYDLVYSAERPELFFKSTPHRTVGPNQAVRVRKDTQWCVPEPELALVFTSQLELFGVTIGNDMSARDIEGENPLYLPQAKLYDACCALGPAIIPIASLPNREQTEIRVQITRNGQTLVDDQTTLDQMKRKFEELAGWLGRDNSFPNGVILLTGTGIVPPDEFSLESGDLVHISITGIGTLTNSVVRG